MPSADFWVGPPAAPDTYRLVTLLGGGGEGEVWQAVLPLSAGGRSTVAVKILRAGDEPDAAQRWERFGHLLRSLTHPGLVRVTDVFTGPLMHRETHADPATRASYVVMDYIDGPTLREWCDEHPDATASQRLRMLRTVASALDEMHSGTSTQIPVAHGDVKPANVVVRDDTGTVLVDLGLARLTDAGGVSGRSTPYAAPELRTPGALSTPEADRYAFAITTAQVLTGQPPPTGPDGWLDRPALESLLRASPITARRPLLVRQILDAITAPPEARPRQLRIWLDSAADTLSQVTTNGEQTSAMQQPVAHGQDAATEVLPTMAAAAPAPTHPQPATVAPAPRRRRRWPLVLTAVLLAVLIGAGLAVFVLPTAVTGAPASQTAAPTTTTNTATPTATTTSTSAPSTTSPGSLNGLPTTSQYLTALQPVDRDNHTGDNGSNEDDTFSSSGQKYGHAISMGAFCSNRDGGDYWIDYDISRSWKTFTTTVGLRDDSPSDAKATYTLIADTKVIATGPLTLGTSTPINVSLIGVLRLRLQINDPTVSTKKCLSGRTQIVWGDPTLQP